MGLTSLVRDARRALLSRAAFYRLKEDAMTGHLRGALLLIFGTFSTILVAKVSEACPAMIAQPMTVITVAVGIAWAYWTKAKTAGTATLIGLGVAFVGGLGDGVVQLCGQNFLAQLGTIATGAFFVALAKYMQSPRELAAGTAQTKP